MDRENKKGGHKKVHPLRRKPSEALRVVIAGGGTGGHLFPGIAIAQEFLAKNGENSVLFVGSGKPFEISILSETGFAHKRITAVGFKGRGVWNQLVSISKVPKGIIESMFILRGFKPHIVVGVGGYAAGPLVMGAWLLGIKIVLHEQNILPGITNRILSCVADRIYVSFAETKMNVAPSKIRFTGNPVRKEIVQCAETLKNTHIMPSKKERKFTILILGGSQGAHSINMALLEALEYLENRENIFFVHQTGSQDEKQVRRRYNERGIENDTRAFFKDMARQYQNADLIICRAGATTVAEIKAIGKGVIFIPFPFAADNHQVLNARSLEKTGAAEMILEKDLSGKILAKRINYYFQRPEALQQMAQRSRELGRTDAATMIVDDCYELIS
ncbi:MAG: undecaprenyldiphospho-muramoylpentapeptide beta-N-acetylglucosaminyltransferase [Deltaproteobacteria bacterium]|jgi:UDP-N-acetylglucosamine--N-acetylmuramyl-(pentapeptide) pyrophosphoryl-undecaprenol N-acetylglucosamine transferase|nr:undecaprenyldiphospho-muramoylpentapeptide beta-N-acetylglucosaminyltransferase [Deltaproteobacteria bacterium]MBW2492765.1 undecaprenyldiphospho-muramoylpentapeptide beta-N-acetylglucosaminyltransferase [Deltaproteobacteria bacterium]